MYILLVAGTERYYSGMTRKKQPAPPQGGTIPGILGPTYGRCVAPE